MAGVAIIRGVCEVWGQAGCCGMNMCVVDCVPLCMALI